MATKRPRTTISFDPDEYQELEEWAKSEFRTIPQMISVIVKKALIEKRDKMPAKTTLLNE
ncbi:ribbon-helix-helix domain-containing protein [Nostoc sp.]|uniref:ribbon-helix-helix domain-containing protein n=1 Tax=Nostoc sp. TaxID=1180 RepID=UPI002FF4552A